MNLAGFSHNLQLFTGVLLSFEFIKLWTLEINIYGTRLK